MSIALSLGNNLTTGGIFKPTAVNNTSVNNVTDFAGIAGGGTLVLLSTQTASASASISFTSGIDSTYDEYVFKIINCHPSVNNPRFQFNLSTDGGSNYNVVKTSTNFNAVHYENDAAAGLAYEDAFDLAQSTNVQWLVSAGGLGNGADESLSGYLHLFNPSDTTYVKHFIANCQWYHNSNISNNTYTAGYCNTSSAINAVQFTMSSGNIDDGTIQMFGIL